MDDARIGAALKAVRVRRRLRQSDVAMAADVPRQTVVNLEKGRVATAPLRDLRAVAAALDMLVDVDVRWQGADLDRLLSEGHVRLHELVGAHFGALPEWEIVPEVTFSIYGERGVIDILAWHAASRCLLIIELKTALGDAQELVAVMDRRVRLAGRIAADRGWRPLSVSAWVVFVDTRTNRRAVARASTLLRTPFPANGHAIRSWLRSPSGSIRAMSFWTNAATGDTTEVPTTPRRVRPTSAERAARLAELTAEASG